MQKRILNPVFALLIFFVGIGAGACQNNTSSQQGDSTQTSKGGVVSVEDFDKQLSQTANAQVVDVRTPQEFEGGHLKNALNININGAEFKTQIAGLDKNAPAFVYCLAGSRSASAANYMREQGFTKVYEMQGGILKWKAANKSLEMGKAIPKKQGMRLDEFKQKLNTDKFVLVDYHAKWCKPCIKMAPMLKQVAEEKKDQLVLLKIDADENEELLKTKGVEDIPVLELYQNGKVIWKHNGFIEKEQLLKAIKL